MLAWQESGKSRVGTTTSHTITNTKLGGPGYFALLRGCNLPFCWQRHIRARLEIRKDSAILRLEESQ